MVLMKLLFACYDIQVDTYVTFDKTLAFNQIPQTNVIMTCHQKVATKRFIIVPFYFLWHAKKCYRSKTSILSGG